MYLHLRGSSGVSLAVLAGVTEDIITNSSSPPSSKQQRKHNNSNVLSSILVCVIVANIEDRVFGISCTGFYHTAKHPANRQPSSPIQKIVGNRGKYVSGPFTAPSAASKYTHCQSAARCVLIAFCQLVIVARIQLRPESIFRHY